MKKQERLAHRLHRYGTPERRRKAKNWQTKALVALDREPKIIRGFLAEHEGRELRGEGRIVIRYERPGELVTTQLGVIIQPCDAMKDLSVWEAPADLIIADTESHIGMMSKVYAAITRGMKTNSTCAVISNFECVRATPGRPKAGKSIPRNFDIWRKQNWDMREAVVNESDNLIGKVEPTAKEREDSCWKSYCNGYFGIDLTIRTLQPQGIQVEFVNKEFYGGHDGSMVMCALVTILRKR